MTRGALAVAPGVERAARFAAELADLSPQARVDLEREAVRAVLDVDYYRARLPAGLRAGTDPVEHFRLDGWRDLRLPNPEFYVDWYLAAHLDPTRDDINPVVHYYVSGADEGLRTRTHYAEEQAAQALPADPRRAVLFAGYDPDGVVDATVIDYVRELSHFADVYYLADNDLSDTELARLDGITVGTWAVRHGSYDFGSWSRLARDLVGWSRLSEYDEVVLVNDSCYPVLPLDRVFADMAARPCHWWGLQATEDKVSPLYGASTEVRCDWYRDGVAEVLTRPVEADRTRDVVRDMVDRQPRQGFHLGSYFLGLRRSVLSDSTFQRFLDSVRGTNKDGVIIRYEWGLTRLLLSRGYVWDTFVRELYPFHPVYSDWLFTLIGEGFPLFKRGALTENPFALDLTDWQDRLRDSGSRADTARIEAHARRFLPAG